MAKVKSKVSVALQETVASHPHIDQVHFTAKGDHYFNIHDHIDNKGKSAGTYGRIYKQNVMDNNGRKFEISSPILETKIVESVSREDILNADPESNLTLSSAIMQGLSEAEIEAVKKIRKNSKPQKVEQE